MSLRGGPELAARLKALKLAWKPIGRAWAKDAAEIIRQTAPNDSGKLRGSVRVKSATQKRAVVGGVYYGHIQDHGYFLHGPGTKRALRRRATKSQTIFAKLVHKRRPGLGFAGRAARESLRKHPLAETLIRSWNEAA